MRNKREIGIVNAILVQCKDLEIPVRPLKLQKLLYYFVGFYWKDHKIWLLDEEFEAWPYGPVHRNVYREFAAFEGSRITKKALYDLDGSAYRYVDPKNNILITINKLVECLGNENDWLLSDATHAQEGPWDKSNCHLKERIPKEEIQEYFAKGRADQDLKAVLADWKDW